LIICIAEITKKAPIQGAKQDARYTRLSSGPTPAHWIDSLKIWGTISLSLPPTSCVWLTRRNHRLTGCTFLSERKVAVHVFEPDTFPYSIRCSGGRVLFH